MSKFKYGDIVVAKVNMPYGVTRNGWKGRVKSVNGKFMSVKGLKSEEDRGPFEVHEEYFDLAEPEPKAVEPQHAAQSSSSNVKVGDKVVITTSKRTSNGDCGHNFEVGDVCRVVEILTRKLIDDVSITSLIVERIENCLSQIVHEGDFAPINYGYDQSAPKQEEPKKVKIRINGKRYAEECKEDYERQREKIEHIKKRHILIIGDQAFVFDLDRGVLHVPTDFLW